MAKKVQSLEERLEEEGLLVGGDCIVDSPTRVVPVSPAIDLMLGGGIPEGCLCIITGPPKVGKTTTCLAFAGNAQLPENDSEFGPRKVYFFNVEGRIKDRDLKGIKNLIRDKSRFKVIKSKPGKILTAEEYISYCEELINTEPGSVFVVDSFSALCTSGEMTADIGERYRADAPVLLARFCRRISNVLPVNKGILLGVTHIIANQGRGMKTWIEASGRKLQYQVDVKLNATYCKGWMSGETQIGQEIYWQCETSALGPPGSKCIGMLRYGDGLDQEAEIIEIALDLGIIKKAGAWYKFPNGEQGQGKVKTADLLVANADLFKETQDTIKEMLGIKNG